MIPLTLDMTLNRSDGSPVTLYRTPEGRHVGPTPVGAITINTGRSPQADADAAAITITLDQPAGAAVPVDFDSEIVVTATPDGGLIPLTLARCWVQSWTRTHLKDFDRYTIQCHDAIGRAAGWYFGDTPWSEEWASERVARLRTIAPGVIKNVLWPMQSVAARDVDNRTVLEVLRLCTFLDDVLTATPDGIAAHRPGHVMFFNSVSENVWVEPSNPPVVDLPTNIVGDGGVEGTRAGRMGRYVIDRPDRWGPDPRITQAATGRDDLDGPTGTRNMTTDLFDPFFGGIGFGGGAVEGWLAAVDMLREGDSREDVPAFAASRLNLDPAAAGAEVWTALLDEANRLTTPFYLSGPLVRNDIPRTCFIRSASITVDGRRGLTDYTITLTPADLDGVRRFRWRDWTRYYRFTPAGMPWRTYKFQHLRGGPTPLTFDHSRAIRLTRH